jgi:hypothetical protein
MPRGSLACLTAPHLRMPRGSLACLTAPHLRMPRGSLACLTAPHLRMPRGSLACLTAPLPKEYFHYKQLSLRMRAYTHTQSHEGMDLEVVLEGMAALLDDLHGQREEALRGHCTRTHTHTHTHTHRSCARHPNPHIRLWSSICGHNQNHLHIHIHHAWEKSHLIHM